MEAASVPKLLGFSLGIDQVGGANNVESYSKLFNVSLGASPVREGAGNF